MGEHERPAVIPVVIEEEVGYRRLRRRRLDCRVRVDDSGYCVEARVRAAPDAHAAVVIGHMPQQPFDGVVHVRAFVDIQRGLLLRSMRRHVGELAFRHPSAANILPHPDVAGLEERFGLEARRGIFIGTVRADAKRRSHDEERVRRRGILWHEYRREELHAVAHRDAVFVLGVVLAGIVDFVCG